MEPIEEFDVTQEAQEQAIRKLKLAAEYGRKSTEELKAILFTGAFNDLIMGYVVATLQAMGHDDLIADAMRSLDWVLDMADPIEALHNCGK